MGQSEAMIVAVPAEIWKRQKPRYLRLAETMHSLHAFIALGRAHRNQESSTISLYIGLELLQRQG